MTTLRVGQLKIRGSIPDLNKINILQSFQAGSEARPASKAKRVANALAVGKWAGSRTWHTFT